jgi:hypothetical protein
MGEQEVEQEQEQRIYRKILPQPGTMTYSKILTHQAQPAAAWYNEI